MARFPGRDSSAAHGPQAPLLHTGARGGPGPPSRGRSALVAGAVGSANTDTSLVPPARAPAAAAQDLRDPLPTYPGEKPKLRLQVGFDSILENAASFNPPSRCSAELRAAAGNAATRPQCLRGLRGPPSDPVLVHRTNSPRPGVGAGSQRQPAAGSRPHLATQCPVGLRCLQAPFLPPVLREPEQSPWPLSLRQSSALPRSQDPGEPPAPGPLLSCFPGTKMCAWQRTQLLGVGPAGGQAVGPSDCASHTAQKAVSRAEAASRGRLAPGRGWAAAVGASPWQPGYPEAVPAKGPRACRARC